VINSHYLIPWSYTLLLLSVLWIPAQVRCAFSRTARRLESLPTRSPMDTFPLARKWYGKHPVLLPDRVGDPESLSKIILTRNVVSSILDFPQILSPSAKVQRSRSKRRLAVRSKARGTSVFSSPRSKRRYVHCAKEQQP
jgi:hypothetical protein